MQVRFSKKFTKSFEKTSSKIQSVFEKRLEIFLQDKFHPTLNNHSLTGRYSGCRSINITGDWRAIYSESVGKNGEKQAIFELLGTHNQLYR